LIYTRTSKTEISFLSTGEKLLSTRVLHPTSPPDKSGQALKGDSYSKSRFAGLGVKNPRIEKIHSIIPKNLFTIRQVIDI